MSVQHVLVAFASQTGTTAGIAQAIADVLRRSGLSVDCRPAGEVSDIAPYTAVVLGSGVFLPRRATDGGGFLERHTAALGDRPVWLFCAGPIGRGRCVPGRGDGGDDCSVGLVAARVGARDWAQFGPLARPDDPDPLARLGPVDLVRVRDWALGIAASLGEAAPQATRPAGRPVRTRTPKVVPAG